MVQIHGHTYLSEEFDPKPLFSTISSLAKRFPQFRLASSNSLDCLREECMDKVSPGDHSSLSNPTYYKYAVSWKPRVGPFWFEVGKIKTLDGQPKFPSVFKLMAGLLSIPSSNADSERGFSNLRKIHTDQHPILN